MASPVLIGLVDAPDRTRGGDWYYRSYVPGSAMARTPGVYVAYVQNHHRARKEVMREADVLVLHAICDADILPVIAARTKRGQVTIFEINDDFRAVQASNPVAPFFAQAQNRRLLFRLAQRCGYIQFSVPELERLYGGLAPHRHVFENQLLAMPPRRKRSSGGRTVIGWGGSSGHLADMTATAPALCELLRKRQDVVFRLMGGHAFARLFNEVPRGQFEHVPADSIEAYHAFVASLDIGIAPLSNDAFNRSRSDVKFLEYACHGVVPVVSHLTPYLRSVRHEENGFLVDGPEDLVARLQELLDDPARRVAMGEAAFASVASTRLQGQHVAARLDWYQQALAAAGHVPRDESAIARKVAAWGACEGAEVEGRFAMLHAAELEDHIHDGLVLRAIPGRTPDATRLFEYASAASPGDHLPRLLLGLTTHQLPDLEAAAALEPASLVSLLALGRAYAAKGDARAMTCFLGAAELEPGYEAPFAAAAAFLKAAGHADEAEEFAHHALRAIQGLDDPAPLHQSAA